MRLEKIPGKQVWTAHDDAGVLIGKLEEKQIGRGARGPSGLLTRCTWRPER